MVNGNGVPSITDKWPVQDVGRLGVDLLDHALTLACIDCLCLHHGDGHDGRVPGVVSVASGLHLLPD